MRMLEGEVLKNKITNDLHWVKSIGDERVILENQNGSISISVRKKDIKFYYEKLGMKIDGGEEFRTMNI